MDLLLGYMREATEDKTVHTRRYGVKYQNRIEHLKI